MLFKDMSNHIDKFCSGIGIAMRMVKNWTRNPMKRLANFVLPALVIISCACRLDAGTSASASYMVYDAYSSGASTSSSDTFRNFGCVGQTAPGNSTSSSYRNYAGFVPAFIEVIDVIISFMDEYPPSSQTQTSINITAKVTVETTGGNTISSVKYRISNSGADESKFYPWRTDASIDTTYSANKIRFQVILPNPGGDSFGESENNFIQWRAKNSGGIEAFSSKYQVKLISNNAPVITIIQPDQKGGVSSRMPLIQALIVDSFGDLDSNSIQLNLEKTGGASLLQLKSSEKPDIFTASKNLLSYKYAGSSLIPENAYRLTVTASDKAGKSGSAVLNFTVKGGAIADLVPYPSPFDPKNKTAPVTLRYVLNQRAEVSVNIYDMGGRIVKAVVTNQWRDAGISEELWYGDNYSGVELANGIYICEVVAKDDEGEHRRYTSLGIFGK